LEALVHQIRMTRIEQLKPNAQNARTHSKKQVKQIASSIVAFGFANPLLVDEGCFVIAGHGRLEAAKLLGLTTVPAVMLPGLTPAKKRALALADNKVAENAGWDRERLAVELPDLSRLLAEEGLDIALTGFEPVEIDQLQVDFETDASDPSDEFQPDWAEGPRATSRGEPLASRSSSPALWRRARHSTCQLPDGRMLGRDGISRSALQPVRSQHRG
jgi:ParB-like chromosome segregation protein Spo0J